MLIATSNSGFTSSRLSLEELAVQLRDEPDLDALGAGCLALVVVAAVPEALAEHLLGHHADPAGGLGPALGQGGKLGDLGRGEEHGRTVGTGRHAGAAADALGRVHGRVRVIL